MIVKANFSGVITNLHHHYHSSPLWSREVQIHLYLCAPPSLSYHRCHTFVIMAMVIMVLVIMVLTMIDDHDFDDDLRTKS